MTLRRVLVELSVVEHQYRAVLEVLAGSSTTAVAARFGVSRQAVHRWLGWYAESGLAGLADRSHRPASHPLQTPASVEAAICELRRAHPRWGPRRLEYELGVRGCPGPVPSRSTIYRVLLRQGLIDRTPRGRSRASYRRWQRDAPMQLWQLDIVGGVFLTGGAECKVVTGVDDHSRLCVLAAVVSRPTGRAEYNTTRPHQSLDMATPAPAAPADGLELRLPAGLTSVPSADRAESVNEDSKQRRPAPPGLAVEIDRVVRASGNLAAVRGQQSGSAQTGPAPRSGCGPTPRWCTCSWAECG